MERNAVRVMMEEVKEIFFGGYHRSSTDIPRYIPNNPFSHLPCVQVVIHLKFTQVGTHIRRSGVLNQRRHFTDEHPSEAVDFGLINMISHGGSHLNHSHLIGRSGKNSRFVRSTEIPFVHFFFLARQSLECQL